MNPTAEQLIGRLRRNPDDSDAFAALRAHYHQRGDYPSLANLLEGWAARNPDGASAADAFFEAAQLCSDQLSDRRRAMSLYEHALERCPSHMHSSLRLQEMLESAGDHRRLLDLLDRRARALEAAHADPRHIAQANLLMGRIWDDKMGRVDRAVGFYRIAFELDPTLVGAIYAAREIYRQAGNLKAASSLYELEANAETNPERKVALLRELAKMRAERLDDIEGAVAALKRARSQAPTDHAVMHDLATVLLRRAESSADAAAAAADRQRGADLLYQMAQSAAAEHAVAYAEAALDAAPGHDGVLELYERLAGATGREEALPLRWVAYLQASPDAPGSDEVRRRLGNAYLDAGQVDDAVVCWEPLLERGDTEAAEALVDLYRDAGRDADRARALSVAVSGMPDDKRVPRLREIIQILVEQGNQRDAAARAREILEIDASDPEALSFLEDDCRARGEWGELRDLLMAAARVPGLSVEARKQRLVEVAAMSEAKLGDQGGAISAWRAITALDPADSHARKALEQLLEAAGRWDELVQVLEREALSLTEPDEKAEVYRRIAHVHRDRRDSLMEAVDALRSLRQIRPDDVPARDDLCDALLDAGAYLEAVPLLRKRVEVAAPEERLGLLRRLAEVLEQHMGDDEGAFATCTRLLDEAPDDLDTVERMERIDRRSENWPRLVETLSYKVEVVESGLRWEVFRSMGQVAEEHLKDLDRAAEYYGQSLELGRESPQTLDALCRVYDKAERYRDLVVLLKNRALSVDDPAEHAELFRRIARTLAERVRNEDAAAEAWHEVLAAGEDAEALAYLRRLAERRGDTLEVADLLGRVASIEPEPIERRDLLVERARLLADDLGTPEQAIEVLREVVESVAPDYPPALSTLARLCERIGDHTRLADTLERRLKVTEDDGLRVPVARQLADLYEGALDDRARATAALQAWARSDASDPEPQRRLTMLYESSERWEELIATLDSLRGIERDDDEVGRLTRRAAELSLERLGDVEGAWQRLVPRVESGDAGSEEMLRALSKKAARGEPLADLYVRLAQGTDSGSEQARRWRQAAGVFEERLDDRARALEAMLRAFAVDLDDDAVLGEVDRIAVAAGAWDRLAQVYDALLRRGGDDGSKVDLLLRHAGLLESAGDRTSEALDRMLRACSLAPDDDHLLARTEELAPRAGRSDELLVVYDRRRARAEDDAGRVDALLRAACLADGPLQDRERALVFVAQAISLSVQAPALRKAVESCVEAMDIERTELGANAAQIALVDIYRRLADQAAEDQPAVGARLLAHASRMLADELADEVGAHEYLKQAASLAPESGDILDRLEELSGGMGKLGELVDHLDKLVDEALEQKTAADLLERRARILEGALERYSEAADVWAQLSALRSSDPEVSSRLRHCLSVSGRHQDLLIVLERELARAPDDDARLEALKAIATTWEGALDNRWEAQDAWKRVLTMRDDDPDAVEALKRLGHSTRKLTADELSHIDEDSGPVSIGDAEEHIVPGPMGAIEGSGEHTDPGLDAHESAGMDFDDETDDEALDPLLTPLGPGEGQGDGRPVDRQPEVRRRASSTGAGQPAPADAREALDHEALDDRILDTAQAPTETTSELDLDDVEEVTADGDAVLGPSADATGQLDALDLIPVSPCADATGQLDALDLIPVSPCADATGQLDALDLIPVSPSADATGQLDALDLIPVEEEDVLDRSGSVQAPGHEEGFVELDELDLLEEGSGPHPAPPPAQPRSTPMPLGWTSEGAPGNDEADSSDSTPPER